MNSTAAKVLRALAVIVLVTGFLGLDQIFSDLGPHEAGVSRLVTSALTYVIGSVLVGFIMPRHWYIAVLNGWGALLLAVPILIGAIRSGRLIPSWTILGLVILVIPGVNLISGRAGAMARHRMTRHTV